MILTARAALERLGGALRAPERVERELPDISHMSSADAAEALLLAYLDEGQRAQLKSTRTFNVTGKSGRLYIVEPHGRVDGYCIKGYRDRAATKEGEVVASCFCSMLATKLLLESNEELFLHVADEPLTTHDWENGGPYARD